MIIHPEPPIILASKSPRRKKLLKQIGLNFKTKTVNVEEKLEHYKKPSFIVKQLALKKLNEAKKYIRNSIIITADTIVILNGEILGKPKDKRDAQEMLKKLSGNKHYVYTGFSILNQTNNKQIVDFEKTCVFFRDLSENEINEYVENGSPMDKAGAYGIQDDYGAVFVRKISGCYYNVVGLPLSKFYSALQIISDNG